MVGEDVTENLKTVKTIPQELSEKINITVRGEVFISKKDFEKNESRKRKKMKKNYLQMHVMQQLDH